jgi:tetratricopeptide (TPR) repeat protein
MTTLRLAAGLAPIAVVAAILTWHTSGSLPSPQPKGLSFVDDDYQTARGEARRSGRLLFVDVGASWCHTCVSLHAFVLTDPELARFGAQYAGLAIDTERPVNAPFLAKFPLSIWPTLWVIDPETEKPIVKWEGAATASELSSLLDDAVKAHRGEVTGEAVVAFTRGKRSLAEGKTADAVSDFRAALTAAPAQWEKRPQVVQALAGALYNLNEHRACIDLAKEEIPRLPRSTSLLTLAYKGLSCALKLDDTTPNRKETISQLIAQTLPVVRSTEGEVLADDVSDLYQKLVVAQNAIGDTAAAKQSAQAWSTFLDNAADQAPTKQARAVFDAHRLLAYIELGQPERALPMLAMSEQDDPTDYNPPARMGKALSALKRYDEAIAAFDRALSKAYGGRIVQIYSQKIDALLAKGDREQARQELQRALAQPSSKDYEKVQSDLEKRLQDLEKTLAH